MVKSGGATFRSEGCRSLYAADGGTYAVVPRAESVDDLAVSTGVLNLLCCARNNFCDVTNGMLFQVTKGAMNIANADKGCMYGEWLKGYLRLLQKQQEVNPVPAAAAVSTFLPKERA